MTEAVFAQPFAPDDTARISFAYGAGSGGLANADINNPQMSKNGRFVVFESAATNLVAQTQQKGSITLNGKKQVYLYDRQGGSLELISVTMEGDPSPVDCFEPTVSNDGRYVAFVADLRNGADGVGTKGKDTFLKFNGSVGPADPKSKLCQEGACNQAVHLALFFQGKHILVRDRAANKTLLASQSELATKRQAYEKGVPKYDDAGLPELVQEVVRVANTRYDVVTGGLPLVDPSRERGDSDSRRPFLSGDGRFLVYDTDGFTGAGYRVLPNITPQKDFNYKAVGFEGIVGENGVRGDDDDYLMPGPIANGFDYSDWLDSNRFRDIYVRDGGDSPSSKVVSFDCRYHQPKPLSCTVLGSADSINPSISDDGRFIAFQSLSPFLSLDFNLVSDAYVVERDKITADVINLERVSNNFSRIVAPNAASQNVRISADGRFVSYDSGASNIALGDTNGKKDVFVFDRSFFQTVRCLGPSGQEGNGDTVNPSVSGSGELAAFHSNSTNWGSGGGFNQVYVANLSKDRLGRVDECKASLASIGGGSGGNGDSSQAFAAVIPRSATATPNPSAVNTPGATPTPEKVRVRVASVAYRSNATNVGNVAPSGTPAPDGNGVADIYQGPTCLTEDLANDQDGDGTSDCFDMCWKDFKKVEDFDSDSDGFADCEDNCPTDPQKQQKGICGCGVEDVDSDFDRTFDCQDNCPTDPAKTSPGACGCLRSDVDTDGDGNPDCDDLCPGDRLKVEPGACGCGKPDFDSSGKLLVGCATPTPAPPTPTPTATPVPFNASTPEKPTVKRLTTRKFEVTVSAAGLPQTPTRYRISIEAVSTSTVVSVLRSSTTKVNVDGLRKGSYRVRYQAISPSGVRSLFSPYSTTFKVR
jgi:Tol biopolymer transport system component